MKNHLVVKIIIVIFAFVAISLGVIFLSGQLKAETPTIKPSPTSTVDAEKTFLVAFATGGVKGYQITEFNKYAVWVDGQNCYNVAGCDPTGNWTVISRIQLATPTPTPKP